MSKIGCQFLRSGEEVLVSGGGQIDDVFAHVKLLELQLLYQPSSY